MAHPYNSKRADNVQKDRVGRMTAACRASGGRVHDDAAEDRAMIKKMVKKGAMRADGGQVVARSDRPNRAAGGRTKAKGKGNTVNIVIAPGGGKPAGGPMVPPMAPPMMPPRPPMAAAPPMPPPGGLPPGAGAPMRPPMSPAVPPVSLPPRSDGGRAYKRGGGVPVSLADKKGAAGVGDRTPIQHSGNKSDTKNIGRGAPITRKTGGPVFADGRDGKQMAPKLPGGAGGGRARIYEADSKSYHAMNKAQAKAARHPGNGSAT